jgi:hypothetical protein
VNDEDVTRTPRRPEILVVSGLPRSGTSMLMQMLEAAGFPLRYDRLRTPDSHNPRGYYEFAPIKGIRNDATIVVGAEGRGIKVVAPLLPSMPPGFDYRVVFIERDMQEVLASQRVMLEGTGATTAKRGADDVALAKAFESSLRAAKAWIETSAGTRGCFVSYARTVEAPATTARTILKFLEAHSRMPAALAAEIKNDRERVVDRMVSVLDPSLYRQRGC